MSDKQSKNITKATVAVLMSVLIGEGVLGLGFFWPFLLVLMEWRGIYWLSVLVGILISVIYHIPIGLTSLFLVVVIGGLSFVFSSRKETGVVILCVSILANLIFDKVFGLPWNVFDLLAIVVAWFVAVTWFEPGESIKIYY